MPPVTYADTPNDATPIITRGYPYPNRIITRGYGFIRRAPEVRPPRPRGRSSATRKAGKPIVVTKLERLPEKCFTVKVTLEEVNDIPILIPIEGVIKQCYDDTEKPRVAVRKRSHRIVANSTNVIVKLQRAVRRKLRRIKIKAALRKSDDDPDG